MSKTATGAAPRRAYDFVRPLELTFTIREREIVLSPLKVGEVGAFAEAIGPLLDHLPQLAQESLSGEAVLELITLHSLDALQAVAIAARVDVAWLRELRLDEALELATLCLEVNADFFRRALPGMQSSGARLMATFSAGQTPSGS